MTKKTPVLFCLGANHKSAGLELREKLYLRPEEITVALPHLRDRHKIRECMVVSTCNRLEIYGLTEGVPDSDDMLFEAFLELRRFGRHDDVARQTLREHCYLHLGREAVRHVFEVCAGLDSLVVGETQITGQFKDATALAQEHEAIGPILLRLTQDALATAKKIRTQTDIGKGTVSISHAAIDLANQVYGAVSEHKVAIIGAGEMGALAARYTTKYKPKRLSVVNRTLSRAQDLVADLGGGEAFGFGDLESVMAHSDIIISSTASQDPIIDQAMVERVQKRRNNRPLMFVDIALPRNVAVEVGTLEDVYLFDIDDLKQVVGANAVERRMAAEKALVIAAGGTDGFMKWLATIDIKPVLSGFRAYLTVLFERETARTLTRDIFKDLDATQREALQAMLTSIANKITSDASLKVREPPDGYYQDQLAEALSVLFPNPDRKQETGS